ncbi:hypothetical protein F0365_07480 [Nonlabens sp. Ci31]|jgi:hypothetical protein|uniref:hypothetical protein n=1 Tax=Nonlabens sp. Ci31 TaxID=2608253 RepID=UPI001463A541|nr:hypothetical protein [Nonlabens sp. Ci31]QJP34257.1 hypothetical protein F0365_07480 [Nonlabens sp. Ci31]
MYRFLTIYLYFLLITLTSCENKKVSFENDLTNQKIKIWKEYEKNNLSYVFNGIVAFDYNNKEWHECKRNYLNPEVLSTYQFDDVEWTNNTYIIKEIDNKLTLKYKSYSLEVSKIQNDTIYFKKSGKEYLFVRFKDDITHNNCW